MSDMKELSAKELEAQANAILAAADEAEGKKPKKAAKKAAWAEGRLEAPEEGESRIKAPSDEV